MNLKSTFSEKLGNFKKMFDDAAAQMDPEEQTAAPTVETAPVPIAAAPSAETAPAPETAAQTQEAAAEPKRRQKSLRRKRQKPSVTARETRRF